MAAIIAQPTPATQSDQPLSGAEINAIYDEQDEAFSAALCAIRASKYPLDVRVRIWSLLDDRLAQSHNALTAQRLAVTCGRVARFFERRALQS